jgi:hypothetical protein
MPADNSMVETTPQKTPGAEKKENGTEKTVIKSLGQCSFASNGDPSAVDVKDGKILRIRPLHYETSIPVKR